MANRKGAGRGTGKGYKNLRSFPRDASIHSQSAKGMKQPQRIPRIIKQLPKAKTVTVKFYYCPKCDNYSKTKKCDMCGSMNTCEGEYESDITEEERPNIFIKADKKLMKNIWSALNKQGVKVKKLYSLEQFPMDSFEHIPEKYAFNDADYLFFREPNTHASFIYDKRKGEVKLLRKKGYWVDNNYLKG